MKAVLDKLFLKRNHLEQGLILIISSCFIALELWVFSSSKQHEGLLTEGPATGELMLFGIEYKYLLAICIVISFVGIWRCLIKPSNKTGLIRDRQQEERIADYREWERQVFDKKSDQTFEEFRRQKAAERNN